MKTTYSLLFYIKKRTNYQTGPVTVYARITVDGIRKEISTGLKCLPENWSSEGGRQIGKSQEAKNFNAYLDSFERKVFNSHKGLLDDGKPITIELLKNKFSGDDRKGVSLVSVFQDHNKKIEALLGKEFAVGTLERYRTSLKHTVDFLKWKYKVTDIDIKQIDHAFITEYEFYLRTVRNCANNSAVKYIKNFGKIVRICLSNGWVDKNPFANYKAKVKEVERVFLTEEELQLVIEKEFAISRIGQVRDIFVFSCYTGLAYADTKNLNHSHIVKGIDGETWISTQRQKTETRSSIPILPPAQAILNKYAGNKACRIKGTLLPVLSNQKMNAYLKEIADLCGINKDFTFHTARHTFATTVTLSNGVPIETVSKMLGHKDLKITQHYAKIVDRKVSDDMKVLKEKMKLPKQVYQNNVG